MKILKFPFIVSCPEIVMKVYWALFDFFSFYFSCLNKYTKIFNDTPLLCYFVSFNNIWSFNCVRLRILRALAFLSNTPVFNPFFDCPLVLRASAIVLFHRLYLTYLAHTFCIFFFEPHFWRASFSRWNAATVRSFANRACIHLSITSKSITG